MISKANETHMVIVRSAREGDAAEIANLATQLGYPSTEADISRRLQSIQSSDGASVIVAEYGGGGVCGWIMVASVESLTAPTRAQVAGLIVDQARRGLGIGAALLQAAVNWARIKGYPEIRVHSNTTRERAHQFYEREEFTRLKTQVLFTKSSA
ncbi:MAG: GNAT family N-acetyltransferase [Dokdonella sp.]